MLSCGRITPYFGAPGAYAFCRFPASPITGKRQSNMPGLWRADKISHRQDISSAFGKYHYRSMLIQAPEG